jgi:hypothetical protein
VALGQRFNGGQTAQGGLLLGRDKLKVQLGANVCGFVSYHNLIYVMYKNNLQSLSTKNFTRRCNFQSRGQGLGDRRPAASRPHIAADGGTTPQLNHDERTSMPGMTLMIIPNHRQPAGGDPSEGTSRHRYCAWRMSNCCAWPEVKALLTVPLKLPELLKWTVVTVIHRARAFRFFKLHILWK